VSGTLGDAALGLEPGAAPALRRRQAHPQPRLSLGRALVGVARAAIDVSDGLLQDLGHLCEASGTGAEVELDRLPLSPEYRRATRGRADAFEAALSGGEDYELLVAVAPARLEEARAAARAAGVPLSVVGRLERRAGLRVEKGGGGRYRPRRPGHDHLRARRNLGRGRSRA
jgi:thiamine-monophosphate kinase